MSNSSGLPRHLRVMRDEWADVVSWLARHTAACLPLTADTVRTSDRAACAARVAGEMAAIQSWVERTTDWFNGPLAQALANPDIADADMRHCARRLGDFADELIEHRQRLAAQRDTAGMAAAAPRIDAMYFALLSQLREFTTRVVAALDEVDDPATRPPGDSVELNFLFKPNINAPADALTAWMKTQVEPPRPAAEPAPASVRPDALQTGRPEQAIGDEIAIAIGVVVAVLIVGAVLWAVIAAPVLVFLIMALIGLLVFLFRHPFIALLAALLGWLWG